METLRVDSLTKRYPGFTLDGVSFRLEHGSIMGLIGRNGAGKSTTLKSMLNYVHPDSGSVSFFGLPFAEHEAEIKAQLGYVSGGVDYYPNKPLRKITAVTRMFYPGWDEQAYRGYLARFALDESKPVKALSAGMKVKYQLALAMSHRAKLLILDEPTSGLDPVSRDDLLDVFQTLVERDGVSILFSTHITSDLEKCADTLTYIQQGRVLYTGPLQAFAAQYIHLQGAESALTPELRAGLIGLRCHRGQIDALAPAAGSYSALQARPATLEEAMVYLERGEQACAAC